MNSLIYPKDYLENLKYRAEALQKAKNNEKVRAALYSQAKTDRLFLFNVFYYTYDPRTQDKTLPFITYSFQDDFILWDMACLGKKSDNLVAKSRDMGASWLLIGNDVAQWLFNPERIETRWGSRKEDYVDTGGDMDSIFEKIRFLLQNLPKWMLPKKFNWGKHSNYMRIINPETGSSITGEATNPSFGRGGRKLRIRFDEFAFFDSAEAAWDGTADVTHCRTAISTPFGGSNKFAMLANGEEIQEKKYLHWTLHPKKNKNTYYYDNDVKIDVPSEKAYQLWGLGKEVRSPWYDAECERRGSPQSVAQELDISFLRSGLPFFDQERLTQHKRWGFHIRKSPLDTIPWGTHIRCSLVEQRGKIKVIENRSGWLRLFQKPDEGSTFVIGADTAEGLVKGDQCAAVVRDKWTRNVFATLSLNIRPEEFAPLLFLMSKFFKRQGEEALIAAENNNHGYSTNKELDDMGANIWRTKASEESAGQPKRGFTTTPQSRPLILDRLEEEVRKKSAEFRCPVLLNQFETFVCNEKTGKPEAEGSFLDDLVIAAAIAGYAIDIKPYKPKADIDYRRKARAYDLRKQKNAGVKF